MFVCELTGCGFESSCSHSNFRFWACFEQGVLWHSGNYGVWIHSETLTCMMRTYSCKWYKASRAYHVRCYKGMKSSFNFNSTETISGLQQSLLGTAINRTYSEKYLLQSSKDNMLRNLGMMVYGFCEILEQLLSRIVFGFWKENRKEKNAQWPSFLVTQVF